MQINMDLLTSGHVYIAENLYQKFWFWFKIMIALELYMWSCWIFYH